MGYAAAGRLGALARNRKGRERPLGQSISAGSGGPLDKAKRSLKVLGLRALDPKTQAAKDYIALRDALIDQYGGPDEVTPAQLMVIEDQVRGRIIARHVDDIVLERLGSGKPLTNPKRSKLLPIVLERYIIYKSLAAQLSVLGLGRRTRVRSLSDGLAQELAIPATAQRVDKEA
jgi:hypothetical protein